MDPRWSQVDDLLASLVREDAALVEARTSQAVSKPGIEVSPLLGQLLNLLAQSIGAKRVLEFGTLAGYSTIWLARAVGPSGRVVSLEIDRDNAAEARRHLEDAGVSAWVDIFCGPAAVVSQRMVDAAMQPFDLVFIDADKPSMPTYLDRAMALTTPGALIVLDNVVRSGRVLDSDEPDAVGVRKALAMARDDGRLEGTAVQTVGAKGWDGFAVFRRVD